MFQCFRQLPILSLKGWLNECVRIGQPHQVKGDYSRNLDAPSEKASLDKVL